MICWVHDPVAGGEKNSYCEDIMSKLIISTGLFPPSCICHHAIFGCNQSQHPLWFHLMVTESLGWFCKNNNAEDVQVHCDLDWQQTVGTCQSRRQRTLLELNTLGARASLPGQYIASTSQGNGQSTWDIPTWSIPGTFRIFPASFPAILLAWGTARTFTVSQVT